MGNESTEESSEWMEDSNKKRLERIAFELAAIKLEMISLLFELENKEDAPELPIQPDNGKSPVSGNGTSQANS